MSSEQQNFSMNSVDSISNTKLPIQSLDQLQKLYGTKNAFQIAQNVVYGIKPRQFNSGQKRPPSVRVPTEENQQEQQNSQARSPPSKFTLLSQQLYNMVPQQLEANKSSRAFHSNYKPETILLSSHRLNSMPSPCKNFNTTQTITQPIMTDVTNRLISYREVVQEKHQNLKEKEEQKLKKECTFQPDIDQRSRNLALKSNNQEIRSADQFHEDQLKHAQLYQERKETALERKAQEEVAQLEKVPLLSAKSERIARIKNCGTNVIDRLFCISPSKQSQQQSQEPAYSFRPEILPKSKNIKREEPVEEHLFKDAKRRLEFLNTIANTQQQSQSTHQLSDSTTGWFVQRFIKEFYYQLSCLERIQTSEQKDYSRLTYSETLLVLQGLNFLNQKTSINQADKCLNLLAQLWQYLSVSQVPAPSVLSRNLLVILLAILAVPLQHTQIPLYRSNQDTQEEQNRMGESDPLFQQTRAEVFETIDNKKDKKIKNQNIKKDSNGNIILDEESAQQIHQTFQTLYLNTKQLSQGNSKRRQNARSPVVPEIMTFPQISDNSHQLSQNKRNQHMGDKEFDLFEWFNIQEQIRKLKHEHLVQTQKEAEMKECTWGRKNDGPVSMTINLNELTRPLLKNENKRQLTTEEIEYARQQNECTFHPQITKQSIQSSNTLNRSQTSPQVQQQISKTAERLKEGRARKQAIERMKEKGMTTNNKQRVQAKRNAIEEQNQFKNMKVKSIKSQPMFNSKKLTNLSGSSIVMMQGIETDSVQEEQILSCIRNKEENGQNNNNKEEERVPLLFVDVNIEEGKTARIVVFEGDKSEELAEKFSNEYNLDESMRLKLKELLDLQISSLLTKIEEDVYEESDQDDKLI